MRRRIRHNSGARHVGGLRHLRGVSSEVSTVIGRLLGSFTVQFGAI
jgi:hypothetical protein